MNKPKYYISKNNEFVIENYNAAPTFASFFPGIAGIYGCPMWVFYANRGQCITSGGVHDKDGAIIEFQPANKAYRSAALTGFRTFLKVDGKFYEPFKENSDHFHLMKISPDSLKLMEENKKLGLRVEITYFTIPNEPFPALARKVKVFNLSTRQRKMEIIDGLPEIVPFGFSDDLLKRISQTTAAWCMVENLDNHVPYFRLTVTPADICRTEVIEKGHFLVAFSSKGSISYIIEPTVVFGITSSLIVPDNFVADKTFRIPSRQVAQGFIPCAMTYKKLTLSKKGGFDLFSLIGQADNIKQLAKIKTIASSQKYFEQKFAENQALIEGLSACINTQTSSKNFDLYARQTFLDNVMRGGFPLTVGNKTVYLYFRKHGDMERDYNYFKLMPTYFSQGTGNYRDINQNHRSNIFFNPSLAENDIVRFFNLIQLDSFNPLVVLGDSFFVKGRDRAEKLVKKHFKNPPPDLAQTLCQPFLLGALLKQLNGADYQTSLPSFAEDLLCQCEVEGGAFYGEGYWIDHFSYNVDLLESYECIYPERMKELLLEKKIFTFYDSDHVVHEREEKYFQSDNGIRQYKSVQQDLGKTAMLSNRETDKNMVRANFGRGKIYYTTLIAKILCVAANKAASFDAEGIGLEMEADKPGWNDALNGLPALSGSSLSETLELKNLCSFTLNYLSGDIKITIPEELREFIEAISEKLGLLEGFNYWEGANQIKELFRQKTKMGISGQESTLGGAAAKRFLENVIKKCEAGAKKCLKKYKNYYAYFINEVAEYEKIDGERIKIKNFSQRPLPLFLEGFVHALKVEKDKNIYNLVRNSPLYDKKLKMYKVNASLKDESIEIGRIKIFTPGWLENESIWLHMEYKYMLELLKAGLHKEFFSDFKNVFIPFLEPKKYKRSILENSSFIVSSANPNQENRGRGFVARLSGATAEFIDIWLYMTTGKKIFYLDKNGKLSFRLSPILPAWLFKGSQLSFKLLGEIDVAYINKSGKNTFGPNGVKPVSYKLILENKEPNNCWEVNIDRSFISEPYASLVRDRKVKQIIVSLA